MPDTNLLNEALRAAEPTPISQLHPDLSEQKLRIVDGAVTITWPFSIVTKSIAFIVAERDFRLRRDKGQVRIKLHGAAAKAFADASVGGGDEVRLSLDGVKWEKNESNTQLAGSTLEWQLEFTHRLLLLIRRADSTTDETVIDIDAPGLEANTANDQEDGVASADHAPTPNVAISLQDSPDDSLPSKRPASLSFEPQEFSSPAFIKRARVSYGSLFEGGFDIFDEDIGRNNKKKKKSRFSLPANAWRYSSRSPSPEAEQEQEPEGEKEHELEETTNQTEVVNPAMDTIQRAQDVSMPTPSRPSMVDEGCQTDEVDFTPMNSVQVSAESRRDPFLFPYASPTPLPRTRSVEAANDGLDHSLQLQAALVDGHHAQSEPPTGYLRHSLTQDHHGLSFDLAHAHTTSYPSPTNPFAVSSSQDILQGATGDFHAPEDYPASFLENPHLPATTIESRPGPSHSSSYEPEEPTQAQDGTSFGPGPHFFGSYNATSQVRQSAWPTEASPTPFSVAIASADASHPVEILSSSPQRERAESEEIPSSPSERTGLISVPPHVRPEQPINTNPLDGLGEEDEDEEDEEGASEEEHYQDGGDRPGDDYDLRNYDRALDDDDEVDQSEEDVESHPEDPDEQIINPEEEEEEEEEEEGNDGDEDEEMESDEEAAAIDSQAEEDDEVEGQEYGEYEGDAEGEYYSEEEGYDEDGEMMEDEDEEEEDEEDEEEEEEYEAPRRPAASSQPVFISLLSDSEDEPETASEPANAPKVDMEDSNENDEALEEPTASASPHEQKTASAVESENTKLEKKVDRPGHSQEVQKPGQPKEMVQLAQPGLEKTEITRDAEDPQPATKNTNSSTQLEQPKELEETEKQTTDPVSTVEEPATEPSGSNELQLSRDDMGTTMQNSGEEPVAGNAASCPADEMDIDDKPSESSMPHNTAEDINSAELACIDDNEKSTATRRPLDEPIQATEQRIEDDQQDRGIELSVVATESPDKEVNIGSPTIEKQEGKTNEAGGIEQPEGAHPTTGEAVTPTEAMDVDEPNDERAEKREDLTATADQEIADTIDAVKEVRGVILETAPTNMEVDQGGLNQVPTDAGSPTTPGNGVKLSSMTSAPAQEIEPIQEGADPSMEKQGHGHFDTLDATMHDALQAEVIAESRPLQAANMPEKGDGEAAGHADGPQQLVTGGQMSPPATQLTHTQPPSQENGEPTLSQETSTFADQERLDHLPTPVETQVEDMAATAAAAEIDHFPEERDNQDSEDDLSPSDQIMAEILQHSPIKYDKFDARYQQDSHPVVSSTAISPKPRPELTETTRDLESNDNVPKADVLSTVKSLRSRGHRSTKSKSSDISLPEPSTSLVKPPSTPKPTGHDDVKIKSKLATLRKRSEESDPSISLAKALIHAEGKGNEEGEAAGKVDNSPPAMKLRVARGKADQQPDPSIALARGMLAAQTQQQPQAPVTPEQTRPRSRGMVATKNTPGTAASAVQSPQVAGPSGAPENETVGAVKLQLLKSLRTELPDFLSLKVLRSSINQATDILALATTTPAQAHRPKHGPRDYMLTLILTDPSLGPAAVAVAHIFRPHQSSLPVVHAGDVVLLRRVQVVSMKGRGFGVRANDASAWAVFEKTDKEMLPQIRGPPVEVTENEVKYAEGLRRWFNLLDGKAHEKMEKASRKTMEAGQEDVK
ncbi:hypothetical protein BGZ63DRAFT_385322 [Mariannaea sp. PMI_226]|nr:hypothetical protein BGZ63DRAFT_385322 [Mariannaea sp. PMI_226]